jgi:hypothetical protein
MIRHQVEAVQRRVTATSTYSEIRASSTVITITLNVKSHGNDPAQSSKQDSPILPILGIIPVPLVGMDLVPKGLESGRTIYVSVDGKSTAESARKYYECPPMQTYLRHGDLMASQKLFGTCWYEDNLLG